MLNRRDAEDAEEGILGGRGLTLRETFLVQLLLGGAAVHRCDKHLAFRIGFSR